MFSEDIHTSAVPAVARDLVYERLRAEGWTVTEQGHFSAVAERGSTTMMVLLGVFSGAHNIHVKCRIQTFATAEGGAAVRIKRIATPEYAGKAGVRKAEEILADYCEKFRDELPAVK
ncbi:hypothetical protein SAMN06309944_1519 [Micrococcales bacterium KH10]|nr:hypothetical protein SAMN06309944_1519 [Micrococcales bacterium KH10]